MDNIDNYINNIIRHIVAFVPDLIKAIIVLIIGLLLIKIFRRFMNRLMTQKKHDPTVLKFLMDLLTWVFRVLLVIVVIDQLGVETSSFLTVIGAAGLAVGLSLQGSLSNFAGGILIILFKPIRVGDYIEAQGEGGTVVAIRIFNTKIITSTNQVIYMPNGALSNGTIKNFSKEPIRKAEITISVTYETDLKQVKNILMGIVAKDSRILTEPAPSITVKALAANSVDLVVAAWAENGNYWQMLSDFLENVKENFQNQGIAIPHPQRDITIKKEDGEANK
jgi:small conductance mechanosensitive channel